MAIEEGKVKGTDTVEAVGVEDTTEEAVENTVIDSTLGEAETVDTEQAATTAELSEIDKLFGPGRFKDLKQVAEYLSFRDRKYGEQSGEIGRLRKLQEEYDALKSQITGQQPAKESAAEITDAELAIFADEFNRNPYAAMDKHYLPKITDRLTDTLFGRIKEKFGPVLDKQAQSLADKQEFSAFVKEHPDYQKHSNVMRELMTDAYLGDGVPFDEAYKLAKLSQEESSLFGDTCKLMQRGMSFGEAREYASLKQNAAANADTTKEQIKNEVAAAAGGLKRAASKQASSEPEITTMDDVVASMTK